MKHWLTMAGILALSLCQPWIAAAERPVQSGMFGDRVLGQPIAPRPSNFGGGIRTGASGSFLYVGGRSGTDDFAMPWRRLEPAVIEQAERTPSVGQPVLLLEPFSPAASPQAGVTAVHRETKELSGLASQPESPGSSPQSPGPAGPPAGIGAPPVLNIAVARARPDAAVAVAASEQAYARSAELSDLLTRIARREGMLAGQGIDVYLHDGTALVQGAVRAPADRTLLTNVVSFAPNVRRIHDRLVVAEARERSSNGRDR